jgi:hypothetical protein
MTKCLIEIENPKYVWVFPKGIKIMKNDGSFIFAIHRKGTEDLLMELSEEELFKLFNEGEIL